MHARRPPDVQPDAADSRAFLNCVADAARRRGVTRLGDVTGLDRIGMPVWQAVRPAGRSLSVHQGKGASPTAAKIGALCEAVECACAEAVEADGPTCAFEALAAGSRAPGMSDYRSGRTGDPPSGPLAWCEATDLTSGQRHYLPHDLVSLDLARPAPPWMERTSSGLGLGATEAGAIGTALFELLERDAVGEWDRAPAAERMSCVVAEDTIALDWFDEWRERLRGVGLALRIWAPPSVVGWPCFIVSIDGAGEFDRGRRRFCGTALHADPGTALFKALAEAIQSRLTFIAGARDDLDRSRYQPTGRAEAFPPIPAAVRPLEWSAIDPAPGGWEAAAERLVALGYRQIAMKPLAAGEPGFSVVKIFVPGLGSIGRPRRPA